MKNTYTFLVLISAMCSSFAGPPKNNVELEDKCYALLKPHIEGATIKGVRWNRYGDEVSFSLSKNVGYNLTSFAECYIDNGDVKRRFESKAEGKIRYAEEQRKRAEEEKKLRRFK